MSETKFYDAFQRALNSSKQVENTEVRQALQSALLEMGLAHQQDRQAEFEKRFPIIATARVATHA